jgi:hypothetical protein
LFFARQEGDVIPNPREAAVRNLLLLPSPAYNRFLTEPFDSIRNDIALSENFGV